jgi:hypothetical protein
MVAREWERSAVTKSITIMHYKEGLEDVVVKCPKEKLVLIEGIKPPRTTLEKLNCQ